MSEKMMGRERCKDKGTSRTVHTEFQKPGAHLQATVFAPKERLTARSAPRMVRKGDARPGKHLSLATFLEKISEKRTVRTRFPRDRTVSDTVSRVAAHDRAGVLARVLAHYRACPDLAIRLPRVEAQNRATPRRLAPPVIFLAIALSTRPSRVIGREDGDVCPARSAACRIPSSQSLPSLRAAATRNSESNETRHGAMTSWTTSRRSSRSWKQ